MVPPNRLATCRRGEERRIWECRLVEDRKDRLVIRWTGQQNLM